MMDMVGQPCGAVSVAVGGHRKPGRWGDKTAWWVGVPTLGSRADKAYIYVGRAWERSPGLSVTAHFSQVWNIMKDMGNKRKDPRTRGERSGQQGSKL
jgi:hypothetical protein